MCKTVLEFPTTPVPILPVALPLSSLSKNNNITLGWHLVFELVLLESIYQRVGNYKHQDDHTPVHTTYTTLARIHMVCYLQIVIHSFIQEAPKRRTERYKRSEVNPHYVLLVACLFPFLSSDGQSRITPTYEIHVASNPFTCWTVWEGSKVFSGHWTLASGTTVTARKGIVFNCAKKNTCRILLIITYRTSKNLNTPSSLSSSRLVHCARQRAIVNNHQASRLTRPTSTKTNHASANDAPSSHPPIHRRRQKEASYPPVHPEERCLPPKVTDYPARDDTDQARAAGY